MSRLSLSPKDTVARLKSACGSAADTSYVWAQTSSGERIRLRPVSNVPMCIDDADVERLTAWRNENRQSFLTDFHATPGQTRRWLEELAGRDSTRILFMLDSEDGATFGHVGLCNIDQRPGYAELDNIVRGSGGPGGAMLAATKELCGWARAVLGVEDMWVRVMADNPAVGFYERLGFVTVKDVPLERHQESDEFSRWVEVDVDAPSSAGRRYLRYMRYLQREASP